MITFKITPGYTNRTGHRVCLMAIGDSNWPINRLCINKDALAARLPEIIAFIDNYRTAEHPPAEEIIAEIGIATIIFDVAVGRSRSFPPASKDLEPDWYIVK